MVIFFCYLFFFIFLFLCFEFQDIPIFGTNLTAFPSVLIFCFVFYTFGWCLVCSLFLSFHSIRFCGFSGWFSIFTIHYSFLHKNLFCYFFLVLHLAFYKNFLLYYWFSFFLSFLSNSIWSFFWIRVRYILFGGLEKEDITL